MIAGAKWRHVNGDELGQEKSEVWSQVRVFGKDSYIFDAFHPGTGEAFTYPYAGRAMANWVGFLEHVDAWVPLEGEPVHAILDNLNVHRATDVLLFSLAHPRGECVFQLIYAAYLSLIEPW
jgi:hypothetical protein